MFSCTVAAVDKMPSAESQDTRVGIEAFEHDAADLQSLQIGKAHLRYLILVEGELSFTLTCNHPFLKLLI